MSTLMRLRSGIPWLIGVGVLVTLAAALVPVSLPRGDDVEVPDSARHRPVGYLTRGVVVTQYFPATGTAIRSLSIQFGTYMRENPGTVHVMLEEYDPAGWRTRAEADIPAAGLADNAFAVMPFPSPLTVTVGRPLRLTVQGNVTDATQAVTLWENPMYAVQDYALTVNGVPQAGAVRFAVQYGRANGPLYALAGAFVARATPLLNDVWRVVLLTAIGVSIAGLLLLIGRQQTD